MRDVNGGTQDIQTPAQAGPPIEVLQICNAGRASTPRFGGGVAAGRHPDVRGCCAPVRSVSTPRDVRPHTSIHGLPANREGLDSYMARLPDAQPERDPIPPDTQNTVDRIMREPALKGKHLAPGGWQDEVFVKHAPRWQRKADMRDAVPTHLRSGLPNPVWKRHQTDAYGELQHMRNLFRDAKMVAPPPRYERRFIPLKVRSFEAAPTRHTSLASKSKLPSAVSGEEVLISTRPAESIPLPSLPEPVEIIMPLSTAASIKARPDRKRSASARPKSAVAASLAKSSKPKSASAVPRAKKSASIKPKRTASAAPPPPPPPPPPPVAAPTVCA